MKRVLNVIGNFIGGGLFLSGLLALVYIAGDALGL